MSLSRDFIEFVECLNASRVEYLLVGGHAVAFHGCPRFTKDIDFWVGHDPSNAERLLMALAAFGFDGLGLTALDFSTPGRVIQLGMPPNRIDLVTSVDGVDFAPAYARRIVSDYQGQPLCVIHLDDLIANKLASGREQDLLDHRILAALRPPAKR